MNAVAAPTTGATTWDLWTTTARLVVTDPAVLGPARALADEELDRVERAASRFRPDSEVRTLDLAAGPELSPVLADLVSTALGAAELTRGRVDPTVGAALGSLGYDRDLALVRDDDGAPLRAVVRRVPGWRTLRLEGRRLHGPAGLVLDLGATAKAAAADRVAALVARELGTGVLVSLGGDLATAGHPPGGGWQVRVQDTPADPAAHLTLAPGAALATSSTQHRTWRRGGQDLHHVLDPATGLPAPPVWRTASVLAPTCAEANALSTAALVAGADALRWLSGPGRPARLVAADGTAHLVGAWPEEAAA